MSFRFDKRGRKSKCEKVEEKKFDLFKLDYKYNKMNNIFPIRPPHWFYIKNINSIKKLNKS